MTNFKELCTEPPIVQFNFAEQYSDQLLELEQYADRALVESSFRDGVRAADPGQLRQNIDIPFDNSFRQMLLGEFTPNVYSKLMSMDQNRRWITNPPDKLLTMCRATFDLAVDMPGFELNWHLDHRSVVVQGVIHVKDNVDESTRFAQQPGDEHQFLVSGNRKGSGVFWLNVENSYHTLSKIAVPRYVIVYTLSLPTF